MSERELTEEQQAFLDEMDENFLRERVREIFWSVYDDGNLEALDRLRLWRELRPDEIEKILQEPLY